MSMDAFNAVKTEIYHTAVQTFPGFCVGIRTRVAEPGWGSTNDDIVVTIPGILETHVRVEGSQTLASNKQSLSEWLQAAAIHVGIDTRPTALAKWWMMNGKSMLFFTFPTEVRDLIYNHLTESEVTPFQSAKCRHKPCDGHTYTTPLQTRGALAVNKQFRAEFLEALRIRSSFKFHHLDTLSRAISHPVVSFSFINKLTLNLSDVGFATLDGSLNVDHDCPRMCECFKRGKAAACTKALGQTCLAELRLVQPLSISYWGSALQNQDPYAAISPAMAAKHAELPAKCTRLAMSFGSLISKIPANKYVIEGWTHKEGRDLIIGLACSMDKQVIME